MVLGHGAAFLGHAASLLGSGPKEELADLRVPEPLRPVRCGRAAHMVPVRAPTSRPFESGKMWPSGTLPIISGVILRGLRP